MKTSLLVITCLLAAAGAALWWFWPFGGGDTMRLSGVVEIQEVRLGPKVTARVYQVLVREGDTVHPGQELLVLEVPEWQAQQQQWKARLEAAMAERDKAEMGFREEEIQAAQAAAAAAKARHERLVNGWRVEEKQLALSEWVTMEAERKQAEQEFVRVSDLFRTKSIARAEFDTALAARDRTRGQAEAAKAKHEMYQKGSRPEDIAEAKALWDQALAKAAEMEAGYRYEDKKGAEARVAEARAKLAEIEVFLQEARLRVPDKMGPARVEVIAVRPGDIVSANQPAIRVLRTGDWWVKVFVSETKLGHVRDGQEVKVYLDSFPGEPFRGVVEQIANISEFTPRNIQSLEERRNQVFAVKIRIENPEGKFHAGMAAEVVFPLR